MRLLLAMLCVGAAGYAFADPKTDYLLYCRGCHLTNGESVPPAVPTLVNELGKFFSIPGGREYLIRVPGVSQTPLDNERLAQVLNWVMLEFNADTLPDDFKPYSSEEVGISRVNILADPLKHRAAILDAATAP